MARQDDILALRLSLAHDLHRTMDSALSSSSPVVAEDNRQHRERLLQWFSALSAEDRLIALGIEDPALVQTVLQMARYQQQRGYGYFSEGMSLD